MEGIPTELIFVLIFIVFSVLEGVGRKKKAQRQGRVGMVPPSRPRSGQGEGEGETVSKPEVVTASVAPPSADSTTEPEPSEGVIPEDVWAEILGLARGTPPPAPAPEPKPLEEPVTESSWDRGSREARVVQERPELPMTSLEPAVVGPEVVQTMPDQTLDPSPQAQRVSEPISGRTRPPGSAALQELFGDGSAKELQKAIILQEVLGPPVGMKE